MAEAAGADHGALVAEADRGRAVEVMGRGAGIVLGRLFEEGRLQGAAAVGGSGNSSIAAAAMRDLPVGVPKLIVSTVASGDTRPYVGAKDVTMMYSVVDIAGINQISAADPGERGGGDRREWPGPRCRPRARHGLWSARRCSA